MTRVVTSFRLAKYGESLCDETCDYFNSLVKYSGKTCNCINNLARYSESVCDETCDCINKLARYSES